MPFHDKSNQLQTMCVYEMLILICITDEVGKGMS